MPRGLAAARLVWPLRGLSAVITRRIVGGLVGMAALAATAAGQSSAPVPANPARGLVLAADRHDTSPALRDMPPAAPAAHLPPASREPDTWRRAGRARTRTTDPVAQTYP